MLRELRQHDALAADSDGDQLVTLRPPAAGRGQIQTTRTCAQIKFLYAGIVGIKILVGFGIVEPSGHPTSTQTVLAMALAALRQAPCCTCSAEAPRQASRRCSRPTRHVCRRTNPERSGMSA